MATASIQETSVTDAGKQWLVQMLVSDKPRDAADPAIVITLAAKIPHLAAPLLAHVQREAMRVADDVLSELLQSLAKEIQGSGHDLSPTRR